MTCAWKSCAPKSIFWQIKVRCVRYKIISVKWFCSGWQLQLSAFFLQGQSNPTTFSGRSKRLCSVPLVVESSTDRNLQNSGDGLAIPSLINSLNPFWTHCHFWSPHVAKTTITLQLNSLPGILLASCFFIEPDFFNTNSVCQINHFERVSLYNIPSAVLLLFSKAKINI